MAIRQNIYIFIVYLMLARVCIKQALGRPKEEVLDVCVLLAEETINTNNISYSEAIDDLVTKANGFYNDAYIVKSSLLTEYGNMYLDPDVTGYLDTKEFMDRSGMLDIDSSVEQTIETLKLHYKFVHEHITYVSAARTHGTISELSSKLHEYERSLCRCLCTVRIALIAAGYTEQVSTNDVEFHEDFEAYSGSIELEVFRAYIVVGDGLVLSLKLKEAYVLMLV